MTEESIKNIADTLLEKVKQLSPEKQEEVLDFVEFLLSKNSVAFSKTSLKGIFSDIKVELTEEGIREIRREMWSGMTSQEAL